MSCTYLMAQGAHVISAHRYPLSPTPLPQGERGFKHSPLRYVPSPLAGEGQGEGSIFNNGVLK
jgi:hypothetical protein